MVLLRDSKCSLSYLKYIFKMIRIGLNVNTWNKEALVRTSLFYLIT